MYIIKTADGEKYWTPEYKEENGWLVFNVATKKGGTQKYRIREAAVNQITDVGETEFDN